MRENIKNWEIKQQDWTDSAAQVYLRVALIAESWERDWIEIPCEEAEARPKSGFRWSGG